MPSKLSLLVLVISSATFVCPSLAQETPCTRRTVPLNAVDRNRNAVTNLTPSSLRVSLRGKPLQILSVEPDTRPPRIVILLDASRSMTDPFNRWQLARTIAEELAVAAPARGSVSLLIFGAKVIKTIPAEMPTSAITQRLAELDRENPNAAIPKETHATALYDAVLEAVRLLNPAQLGDTICAITDGDDNASEREANAALQQMEIRGIRFFAFLLGDDYNPHVREPERLPFHIKQFADRTGGNITFVGPSSLQRKVGEFDVYPYFMLKVADVPVLRQSVRRMYQQMAGFYRVELQLPSPPEKGNWKFEAVDDKGKRRRDVHILYPRRPTLCPGAP